MGHFPSSTYETGKMKIVNVVRYMDCPHVDVSMKRNSRPGRDGRTTLRTRCVYNGRSFRSERADHEYHSSSEAARCMRQWDFICNVDFFLFLCYLF